MNVFVRRWTFLLGFAALLLAFSGCRSPEGPGAAGSYDGENHAEGGGSELANGEKGTGDPVAPWATGPRQDPAVDGDQFDPDTRAKTAMARLRPGLSVGIAVFVAGVPELEETTKRIPDSGAITLPLIGEVQVAGLTLGELSSVLSEKYGAFFVDPKIIAQFVLDKSVDGKGAVFL